MLGSLISVIQVIEATPSSGPDTPTKGDHRGIWLLKLDQYQWIGVNMGVYFIACWQIKQDLNMYETLQITIEKWATKCLKMNNFSSVFQHWAERTMDSKVKPNSTNIPPLHGYLLKHHEERLEFCLSMWNYAALHISLRLTVYIHSMLAYGPVLVLQHQLICWAQCYPQRSGKNFQV